MYDSGERKLTAGNEVHILPLRVADIFESILSDEGPTFEAKRSPFKRNDYARIKSIKSRIKKF